MAVETCFLVTREYDTHVETWLVLVAPEGDLEALKGYKYNVYHSYHRTKAEADWYAYENRRLLRDLDDELVEVTL
jgi:hypothetical protein